MLSLSEHPWPGKISLKSPLLSSLPSKNEYEKSTLDFSKMLSLIGFNLAEAKTCSAKYLDFLTKIAYTTSRDFLLSYF